MTTQALCAKLRSIMKCRRRHKHPHATHFVVAFGRPVPKEENMPLKITLTTEQKELVTFVPTSDAGKEVKSDEPVKFAVTSGTVTLMAPSPDDGVSQFIVSGDAPETGAVVTVTDASGNLTDTVTVDVTAPTASHFVETAAPPVAK